MRPLTPRETEALSLLAGGLNAKTIALSMGCAMRTVRRHLTSARAKLGADTREQAVAIAVAHGLVGVMIMDIDPETLQISGQGVGRWNGEKYVFVDWPKKEEVEQVKEGEG